MSTDKKLPDLPSELILLALSDMVKCEVDPIYTIYMETWHRPLFKINEDGEDTEKVIECRVCFAGSIMAQTLEYNLSYSYSNKGKEYNEEEEYKFNFLDNIRSYYVDYGYIRFLKELFEKENLEEDFNRIQSRITEELNIFGYHENSNIFKENMQKIAEFFAEVGL